MNLILKAILSFMTTLIHLICLPLDLLIENQLPGITDALTNVGVMLNWLVPFTKWVLSYLPFTPAFYTFLVSTLIFIFVVPLLANTIKVLVKWWHYLVP